jgi:hypothetical protein
MSDFKAFAEAVTKICDAADYILGEHSQTYVRERVRNSLCFYRAAASTNDASVRAVSFDAAVRELRAAAKHLDRDAKFSCPGWKPISI